MTDERDDGGPAYPSRGGMMFYVPKDVEGGIEEAVKALDQKHEGLSLRDDLAKAAMAPLLAFRLKWNEGMRERENGPQLFETVAAQSYQMAQAMLMARKK